MIGQVYTLVYPCNAADAICWAIATENLCKVFQKTRLMGISHKLLSRQLVSLNISQLAWVAKLVTWPTLRMVENVQHYCFEEQVNSTCVIFAWSMDFSTGCKSTVIKHLKFKNYQRSFEAKKCRGHSIYSLYDSYTPVIIIFTALN